MPWTSGIGLIHESLTHGFIVFDKIPRILFMRKFWHNGKPWQEQARSSRCPGLRPHHCWLRSFHQASLVLSNSQSKLPCEREQHSSLYFKNKMEAVPPRWACEGRFDMPGSGGVREGVKTPARAQGRWFPMQLLPRTAQASAGTLCLQNLLS